MKWIKENGTKIETNDSDETFAYCVSLGWKEAKGSQIKVDPKGSKIDLTEGKVDTGPVDSGDEMSKKVKSGKINKRNS